MAMKADQTLDATGIACPMPVVKTKKAMDQLDAGQVLEVHATDKGAKSDLTAWARSGNHDMMDQTEEDGVLKFWIKKGE